MGGVPLHPNDHLGPNAPVGEREADGAGIRQACC